jgi:IS30 family transposase
MSRTYHHLSPEDRAMIMIECQNGSSLRSIARRLGRSPSTLSRELRRAGPGMYDATGLLKAIANVAAQVGARCC